MPREGLVSTIIPVFNRARMLQEAVSSVLAQTYQPIEIIIVDDGSTDDTPQAIAALVERHPGVIRAIRMPNGGPGAAREAGRQIAEGEFIQYLDSDDILWPQKFALQVTGLRGHPACDVAYGKTRFYSLGDTPSEKAWKRTGERIATMFPSFLDSRWWDTSTPLYRRAIVDRAGPWIALRNEEDWVYDCRMASLGAQLHYTPEFVSDTRAHAGDMLSRNGRTPLALKCRAEAHRVIFEHARHGGISTDMPEMQHFSRKLFLLARQCGAADLSEESHMLFNLARMASGPARARGIDFVVYSAAATLLGWTTAGRLSNKVDALRP